MPGSRRTKAFCVRFSFLSSALSGRGPRTPIRLPTTHTHIGTSVDQYRRRLCWGEAESQSLRKRFRETARAVPLRGGPILPVLWGVCDYSMVLTIHYAYPSVPKKGR